MTSFQKVQNYSRESDVELLIKDGNVSILCGKVLAFVKDWDLHDVTVRDTANIGELRDLINILDYVDEDHNIWRYVVPQLRQIHIANRLHCNPALLERWSFEGPNSEDGKWKCGVSELSTEQMKTYVRSMVRFHADKRHPFPIVFVSCGLGGHDDEALTD